MLSDFTQFQLGDLLDTIKREARVKGTDQLDDLIVNTINNFLEQQCLMNRFFEMLTPNYQIPTVLNTGIYSAPPQFQLLRLLRYQRSDGFKYTLRKRSEWVENPPGTRPKFYEVSSIPAQINIFPFDDVPDGDTLLLDYYQYPTPFNLSALSAPFPIPKLVPSCIQRCIYRVHIFNNEIQAAQALKGDAVESEIRSKPSSTIS